MSASHPPATCDYCGLPVPAPLWGLPAVSMTPQYCCLGCRVAEAVVREKGDVGANRATMTRLGLAIFFSLNVMVFTFTLWAYDLDKSLGDSTMAGSFAALLRSICLLASLPVLLLLGGPLAQIAWQQLRRRAPSTDLLILLAVVAAYAYSAWSVWTNSGSLYVETACVTLVFLTLGRWFEATGKLRSTESLQQLEDLLPETVTRVGTAGSENIELASVQAGDRLRVRAGQRIPADGILCSATASLDQQLVSGESWPKEAVAGDRLVGGTLNLVGDIVLQVTAPPSAGTLARLVAAVRESRLKQGPYARLADRIMRVFFPLVMLVALGTFIAHWLLAGFASALLATLSVLLIACPCALGIATPLAVWVALGTAARRGIVIGSGEILERLATAKAIRFDKTGTLTTGNPVVTALTTTCGSEPADIRARALLLAESSTHLFSQAIVQFCRSSIASRDAERDATVSSVLEKVSDAAEEREFLNVSDWPESAGHLFQRPVTTISGRGVASRLPGEALPTALGNPRLMTELELQTPADLAAKCRLAHDAGWPVVLLGWGGRVNGLFVLNEQLRSEVAEVLAQCRALDLDVAVLTGDHAGRGARLSAELAVPVQAELDPQQKIGVIRDARKRHGPIIMVGDGLNDAAACSTADVGIALGCGADVTRDSAGVCLVSNELPQIPWLIVQGRRTVETIRRNLLWSFAYNSVGVTLAALGWLHPSIAAVLMVGSSLYVIRNSLRLEHDRHYTAPQVETREMSDLANSGNSCLPLNKSAAGAPAIEAKAAALQPASSELGAIA